MAGLKLTDIKKSYGAVEILHGISLEIYQGEFVVFVGPSGCGKSTLLRTIAGLESITGGTLEIGGEVVNNTKASKRGIAMVFQSYALYPHMTVYNNIAFGMKIARTPKDEIDRRVREAAEILHLTPFLGRLPKTLSGGQRQRVAIGRTIVRDPKVFLFDEPLSNLDAALRVNTRIEIAKLKASMPNATMVYVTHDQVEAMTLADRIVVLNDGYIEQIGRPTELYHQPANLFVARFIGSPAMNILAANIESAGDETVVAIERGGKINLPIAVNGAAPGTGVQLGVRPENLRLADSAETGLMSGTIDIIEALGEVTLLYVDVPGLEEPLIAKLTGDENIKRGTKVGLTADAGTMHLFNEAGRAFAR